MKNVTVWIGLGSVLAVGAALLGNTAFSADHNVGWKIDRSMKFSFAYLQAREASASKETSSKPVFGKPFQPDITNIEYAGLFRLGFPLKQIEHPEAHRFLIKLYEFPKGLNAKLSSHRALDPFYLGLIPGGAEIIRFSEGASDLAVKFSVVDLKSQGDYTEGKPFPPFSLPGEATSAQNEFDSNIPFTSIYLNPQSSKAGLSVEMQAQESAEGVVAFHRSILEAYRRNFQEIAASDTHFAFAEPKRCLSGATELCGIHVIEIRKEPFVFKNFRDLPMPQDPSKVFLSGLLLMKTTEFALQPENKIQLSKELSIAELEKSSRRISSQMLEIGSVLDLRRKR